MMTGKQRRNVATTATNTAMAQYSYTMDNNDHVDIAKQSADRLSDRANRGTRKK